jgi:hypothetical protein
LPIICVEIRLSTIDFRDDVSKFARAFAWSVSNEKGYDLSGLGVYGDPLFVGFWANETPHFIGFRFKFAQVEAALARAGQAKIEIIREFLIYFNEERKERLPVTPTTRQMPQREMRSSRSLLMSRRRTGEGNPCTYGFVFHDE